MTVTQRFYVSTSTYVGPHPDEPTDTEIFRISTTPCRHVLSGNVVDRGYCGSHGDRSTTANGAFDTVEAAKAYVETDLLENDFRSIQDRDEGADYYTDPGMVAVYLPGVYPTMSAKTSLGVIDLGETDILATTTDQEITALVADWNAGMVQATGSGLDVVAVFDAALEYRDEFVHEAAEDVDKDEDDVSDEDEDEQIELTARVGDVELFGTHSMRLDRMRDQDLLDAIADLMGDIPAGQPGQVVEILDARGKGRGTLTYVDGSWEYENPA